jgi:putative IMPACT (imprinted ancient) family translation regulator
MLEVLRGREVSDVVAVVTRWFGGTLLGAGGLVRAYGDAVRAALDEAGTLRRSLVREHLLELDHADAGRVESELRARGIAVLGTTYAGRVSLTLGVPPEEEPRLAAVLAELTAGAATTQVAGERWVDSLGP